jgi:hypothetical protein
LALDRHRVRCNKRETSAAASADVRAAAPLTEALIQSPAGSTPPADPVEDLYRHSVRAPKGSRLRTRWLGRAHAVFCVLAERWLGVRVRCSRGILTFDYHWKTPCPG